MTHDFVQRKLLVVGTLLNKADNFPTRDKQSMSLQWKAVTVVVSTCHCCSVAHDYKPRSCNVQCIKQKIRMSRMSYNRQSITHNSESFTSLLPPGLGSYFQRSKVYLTYFTWLDLEALLTVCNKDFNKTSSLSALKYNWRIPALNVFNPQSGLLVCFLLANKTSVISDYRKCCSPLLQYRTRLWASLTGLLATHEAVLTGLMQSQHLLLLFLAPNCQYELVSCSNVSTFKTNHSKPTF